MSFMEFTRRRFLGGLASAGAGLAWMEGQLEARQVVATGRRPLVVTSKTNDFVREGVTTAAWDIMQAGGSALDAAEKGTNVSELDPRDPTVGYGGDPNEMGSCSWTRP